MTASTPVFEIRDASVVRGGRSLLDAVSLTVDAGELLVVLGENGAGKSTLLRLLAGDFEPDRGSVLLNGRSLAAWSDLEQARQRAVLPQQTAVAFDFTALEVVLLGRSPHNGGRPGARDREIALDALSRFDASQFAERRYPTLSGGERARVMLARAFAQVLQPEGPPRALLLDEPSAALDVAHRHGAFDAILDLVRHERVAVVAVLHDLNLAAAFADRVALLKAGRLIAVGGVDETLGEAALSTCFSVPMKRLAHPTRDVPLFVAVPSDRRIEPQSDL
jgi:iron complex transport system ATP-binding protein